MHQRVIDPTDIAVGRRLRLLRTSRGVSQTVLADALGITFQQVQKYEKGFNRISSSRLATAAKLLGVEPAFFFQEAASSATDKVVAESRASKLIEFLTTKEAFELNKYFVRISSPSKRNTIIRLVEGLAEES